MNSLMLAAMLTVTTAEYLVRLGWPPRVLNFLPEMFSALVLLYVIAVGARFKIYDQSAETKCQVVSLR
jgi:hypothetical protein